MREKEKSRGEQRYCCACHAQYMRENRPAYSDMPVKARRKSNARAYANTYQRRGKLEPQGCKICGEPAQKHHEDYSKPLEVTWFCRQHHLEHHRSVSGQ